MSAKSYKPFRFKRFEVAHSRSVHKVGVDGVLLGLWSPLPKNCRNTGLSVVDVGCGSGVISLIIAQRLSETGNNDFRITGLEVDIPSAEEATSNFRASEWVSNLSVENVDFGSVGADTTFDMIISNPPYFDSGVVNPGTRRERARHQSGLSPESLILRSVELLNEGGLLSMIVPIEQCADLIRLADDVGLCPYLFTRVKGHPEASEKRGLLSFVKRPPESTIRCEQQLKESTFILETQPGSPTDEYRELGRGFYLYF